VVPNCIIENFAKPSLEYRHAFRAYWRLKDGVLPRFDWVLLGMEVDDAPQAPPEHHGSARLLVTRGWQ
jgi:hypothetical protein